MFNTIYRTDVCRRPNRRSPAQTGPAILQHEGYAYGHPVRNVSYAGRCRPVTHRWAKTVTHFAR